MNKLEQAIEQHKGVIDTNLENTKKEFVALRAETANHFQVVSELFKESLSTAISAHDGAINAQFAELKEMIAASAPRSSPLPKKHRNADATNDPYQAR